MWYDMSMIVQEQELRLGMRGFVMMILGRLVAAIFLFAIAFVIAGSREPVVAGALQLFNVDPQDGTTVAAVSEYISFGIDALFAISVLLIIGSFVLTWLEYICFTFSLREFGLRLRRGILNRREVTIPYRHMQDINVHRDLLFRLFGVSTLIIDSAGHEQPGEDSETDVIISPIDWQKAADVREFLQRRIAVQIVTSESAADRETARAQDA